MTLYRSQSCIKVDTKDDHRPDGWRLQSSSAPQHQTDLHKGVPASKSASQVIWPSKYVFFTFFHTPLNG